MMNILSIVWNWDPTCFMLGDLDIRWYGLMWALAILAAERVCHYTFKHEGLPPRTLESAFMWIVLGTFIGARVGHCLFYEPETYLPEPWRIITDIRDGGMASHGATIGIILGIWFFVKRNHLPFIWGLDRIAIVAPLSGAIIRLGNLFNSEIVGYTTDVPWGFKFVYHDARQAWLQFQGDVPAEIIDMIPARHPAQLYEALCYFLTFAVIIALYYRKDLGRRRPGILFGIAMIGIFLTRFFLEFLKERQVDFEAGMALDMGQLLSIPFILIGVYMIIRAMRRPAVSDVNAVVAYANKMYAKEDKEKNKRR
ncbi:MAG: prolipoprotein diacylglyceryl transferase [Alistipes sp.]|nr:prolipoprotein diacylglyceryl transferase [Alistipes sp.]